MNGGSNADGHGPLVKGAVDQLVRVGETDDEPVTDAGNPTHLRIRTFGPLALQQAGPDYAPALLAKPVLAFIWLLLFIRGLLEPRGRVDRGWFAEEFSPGHSPEKQRKRLRDRLNDMLYRDLPEALAARLVATRQDLGLDLERTSSLTETEGEFLAGWEQIEQEANGGRGAAPEYVRALREAAESAKVDILGAVAANYLARQQPAKAISLLEQALERQPEREDVAWKLVAAYLETGQHARAANLQRENLLQG